jgi:hypothetical protein
MIFIGMVFVIILTFPLFIIDKIIYLPYTIGIYLVDTMSETVTTPSSFSDIIQILNLEEREQLYQITYEYDILPQGVVNTSLFYKV